MTEVYNILGLIGSFCVSWSLVPQIYKVIKSKNASDISKTFQIFYVVGLTLIMVYSVAEALWPIWLPTAFELAGGLILLFLKHYFDGKDKSAESKEDADESVAEHSPSASRYRTSLTPTTA